MDVNKLRSLTHWLEYSAFTLNTEKSVILNSSLLILQNENHFKKVFFWGLIQGVDTDYYIAFGYSTDALTDCKYFYSEDCQNWKLLPNPQQEHLILTELCKRPFQGDPGLVIEVVDDAPPEEISMDEYASEIYEPDTNIDDSQNKSSNEETKKSISNAIEEEITQEDTQEKTLPDLPEQHSDNKSFKKEQDDTNLSITSGELKEEDRLAAIVQIITQETFVVPRGGLFKQTDGITVHSRAFEGLKIDDADELCSFQHYRIPQQEWNTNLLTRVDYNYAIDFLDTIDKDIPSDIWIAQLVEGDRAIVLRNLTWPGYSFFHHLETSDYGCFYVGSGQRNLDVPFMTQVNEPVELTEPSISTKSSSKTKTISKLGTEGQVSTETEDEVLLPVPHKKSLEEDTVTDEIITSA